MLVSNASHFLQITYSVPYALVSSRIDALGLGQGRLSYVYFDQYSVGQIENSASITNSTLQACQWAF